MSRYGYLEVFNRVPWIFEITRVDCMYTAKPAHPRSLIRIFVVWLFTDCLVTAQADMTSLGAYVRKYYTCTFKYEIHEKYPENITKKCLYNFDPLKPNFYIVKLGFTGVYIIFLISAQNIDSGYSLEPPHRGGSNEYLQSMFWAEIWKITEVFIWNFSCFCGKIFSIFE